MAFEVTTNRAAKARRAVIFCVNEAYFPYALLAASQVRALCPSELADIVICAENGEIPASLSDLDIRLARLTLKDQSTDMGRLDQKKPATYHRLFLPHAFKEDYDRILYLDSDIFIERSDFARLLEVDLKGHVLAAVRDEVQWFNPERDAHDFRTMGIRGKKYFNAGVLIINCQAYRDNDILSKALDANRMFRDKLKHNDQPLLNAALRGEWLELSPVWNWQHARRFPMLTATVPVGITHFIGKAKPWNDSDSLLPPRYSMAFQHFMARHFPDRPEIKISSGCDVSGAALGRQALRSWWHARKITRYLKRFPDDLVAKE
jgi:hypothetical protein